ncbi:hypothetical protein QP547_00060 [Weeksella virosa]|nr:hypothetical protein [Weeksella virosa]MDK7674206.1 hypothetical protein [Weeksella virosa]SUP53958.1 Uncharacterised protein [Weeksella virosa]
MKTLFFFFTICLWVSFSGFAPANFTHENITDIAKEQVVYITKTGKKYHKGSCHHLKKSKIEINKKQSKKENTQLVDCVNPNPQSLVSTP